MDKGGKGTPGGGERELTTDYIQLPALMRWLSQPGGAGGHLIAGPGVSFSGGCDVKTMDPAGSSSESCSDAGRPANLVVIGTVGLGFPKGRAGVEGLYGLDRGDAFKDKATDSSLSIKNSIWSSLIGASKQTASAHCCS